MSVQQFVTQCVGISFLAAAVMASAGDTTRIDHYSASGSAGDFIARFSGAATIGDGNEPLVARSTKRQRERAADYLISELGRRGLPAARASYTVPNLHFLLDFIMPPMRGTNIVSFLPATSGSDRYVILGAHYDSEPGSPGANDNATGVAIVMATAEALAKLEERKLNVLIVLFDQEEEGEIGSQAFARDFVASGRKLHSVHNVDLVGWDGDGDRVIELDLPTQELERLYRLAAAAKGITIRKVSYNSSDHVSFRKLGLPAVCMGEEVAGGDMTPHIHKPTDTIDHVDLGYVDAAAGLLTEAMTRLVTTG